MANFSFLADKAEFRAFAKDCIDAEESLQNSFESCVKLVRTAVESAVKWLYATDKNLSAQRRKLPVGKKDNLFDLLSEANFERTVGKNLLSKLHYCRKTGNAAIHNERTFAAEDAVRCLKYLFDFVQWIDSRYGQNFKVRTFDADEIPAKESTLKKVLKGAGFMALGAVGVIAAALLSGDDKKS